MELKYKPLKFNYIIILAFACLLFGHLLLRDYMPNPAFGLFGFIIIYLILFFVLIKRKDEFAFILIIYICSHFSYANNQGGLWNIIAFTLLLSYILFVKKRKQFLFKGHPLINILMGVLIISNFLGLVLNNPMSTTIKIENSIIFLSYILMFYFVANQKLTPKKTKYYILVCLLASIYMFVTAVNQKYAFINFNTPLLGAYSHGSSGTITYGTTRAMSTLRHYELFGEYSMLSIAMFIPFFISRQTKIKLNINQNIISIILLISIFNLLLSGTRSSVLLSIFIIFIYFIIYILSVNIKKKAISFFLTIFLFAIPLTLTIGNFFGLDTITSRMEQAESQTITTEGIITGKDINRGTTTEFALHRLSEKSWILGYGYGTFESNLSAWFSKNIGYSGLHSLYLGLPMIYGWFGSVAFILLLLTTLLRLFILYLNNKNSNNYLFTFVLGFIIFWIAFLINEYKISILRNTNYHMLFWIWLGLSNAIIKTSNYTTKTKKFMKQV